MAFPVWLARGGAHCLPVMVLPGIKPHPFRAGSGTEPAQRLGSRCATAHGGARPAARDPDARAPVQSVYGDLRGNVLVHVKVPALGLNAVQWAVISWAQSQVQRETVADRKYIFRCAEVPCCTLKAPVPAEPCGWG